MKKTKASESASALAAIDEDDDSLASRFVSRLLKWLLQGFLAKNKIVRYRAVFIVSELISHLGEIEQVVCLRSAAVEANVAYLAKTRITCYETVLWIGSMIKSLS